MFNPPPAGCGYVDGKVQQQIAAYTQLYNAPPSPRLVECMKSGEVVLDVAPWEDEDSNVLCMLSDDVSMDDVPEAVAGLDELGTEELAAELSGDSV